MENDRDFNNKNNSGKGFSEDAKSTAREFKDGWNDMTQNGQNKKILAGVIALFLGQLGVHKFILGYTKEGLILLITTIVGYILTCVGVGVFVVFLTSLIPFIEGIVYLTKSDEEFYATYQMGKKPWF
ncbi:MAG: TM2 domain-containing protein [Leeuwenhoekiella sp.]